MSPCAYVVGLLDPVVIDELELRRRGLEVFVADLPPGQDPADVARTDPARLAAAVAVRLAERSLVGGGAVRGAR